MRPFLSPSTSPEERSEALRALDNCLENIRQSYTARHKRPSGSTLKPDNKLGYAIFDIPDAFYEGSTDIDNAEALDCLLQGLRDVNVVYRRHHPEAPRLIDSGVVYGRTTVWNPYPAVLEAGFDDCKALTAEEAAECDIDGEECLITFRFLPRSPEPGALKDFHIMPFKITGFDDVSKRHGMGADEIGIPALDYTAP